MMKFLINVNKKHAVIIIALFVIAGFGIAQSSLNPGHDFATQISGSVPWSRTAGVAPSCTDPSIAAHSACTSVSGWGLSSIAGYAGLAYNSQRLGNLDANLYCQSGGTNCPAPSLSGTVVAGGIDGILCPNTLITWGGAYCTISGGTYVLNCPVGSTEHITGYRSTGPGTYDLVYICVKD